jgi:hypothetical protein
MENIEKINIAVIKNETIDEPLDDMRYGFLTNPKFQDNGTELDIIFDLLVPINDTQHIITKSGSKYLLKGMTKEDYLANVDVLTDLIQVSMEHTRRMFIQRNPDYAENEIKHFDKNHFIEELFEQFKEQGLK